MLSIIIPVHNEVESLRRLHAELDEVARDNEYSLDIILVDDGSTDGSWDVIEQLASKDGRVRGIRFRRNFGKAAALSAGFEAARGGLVLTLDADLQDDPREIPRLVERMGEELDVVSGWKKVRHDPWHKVIPSRCFNWMVSRMTGIKLHDHNCGFKCYRREVFDEVRLYGELHRFVPVLAGARGFRVGEIVVNHRPREHGHSKYGVWRIPKGLLDLLTVKFVTGFGQRPQHVLGMAGLIAFALGGLGLTILTALWIVTRIPSLDAGPPIHLHDRAIFYFSITSVIVGAQFMSIGLLAELMTAQFGHRSATYSIAERVGDQWQMPGGPSGDSAPGVPRPAVSGDVEGSA